jgi:hypothetical protein
MASIDSDVAAVMALEQPVKDLLAVFEAAMPALKRLDDYPGADYLSEEVGFTIEGDCSGGLTRVLKAIDMLRAAKGNPAAYDYEYYVRFLGCTPDEVITERHLDIDRGWAMRQYAAKATR